MQLMFNFLEERQQLNPKIFVGIEGTGISGLTSGDDKRLLMEWELTEEASNELRNRLCDDILWSKQILYHWLFEWVLNPWGSNIQMAFNKIFYDAQFPCNQWNSYNRKGGPQMFASSYDDITTRIDEILSNNMKVANANFHISHILEDDFSHYDSSDYVGENCQTLHRVLNHLNAHAQPNFPLLVQNLNALATATGNVTLELSRLPNIPTTNVAVQVNQILRNQQQMTGTLRRIRRDLQTVRRDLRTVQQTQRTDHRRLRRIRRSIQALDVRSFCRTVNSRISNPRERIEVLPNLRNVLPNNFPANVSQLRRANGQTIDNLLAFYGLQVGGGLVRDRRRRLAEYIGVKVL
ncbi:hypothetical protein GLOIN_2v100066 [Rhizophagus irregularis DAOM 181602=DAOM 197198]|nr:hypothetical protein GLOIN_2v100066 [Rhizophagus irregularis DAOM 181602=DAOM 197198]